MEARPCLRKERGISMFERGRRFRKPDLMTWLTASVGIGFAITLLLPYL